MSKFFIFPSMRSLTHLLLISFLFGCSSEPVVKDPEWISGPSRIVDNGYIVYVGSAEDMKPERAQLKAEGQALEDLANECSLIPRGTRIEDRFTKKIQYASTSYVKIALEFQDCEKGKNAQDPDSIRRVANASFTEELKKYQDFMETGDLAPKSEQANTTPPESWPETPPPAPNQPASTQFFVVRQYVAYQKEVVVLSPPQYYAPQSPETTSFNSSLASNTHQLTQIQQQNPDLAKSNQTWSTIPNRPVIMKPASLHPHYQRAAYKPLVPPARAQPQRQQPPRMGGHRGGRGHHSGGPEKPSEPNNQR
jgi:hypothetical protein